jgi:hypothetical protein
MHALVLRALLWLHNFLSLLLAILSVSDWKRGCAPVFFGSRAFHSALQWNLRPTAREDTL